MTRPLLQPTVGLLWLLVAACGSDATTSPPPPPVTATLTVDASQAFAYVKLGVPAQVVTVSDAATSAAWDLGFFATNVIVNGGAVGPAGVTAYCICQNATATDASVMTMTVDNQLTTFEAVGEAAIPAEA